MSSCDQVYAQARTWQLCLDCYQVVNSFLFRWSITFPEHLGPAGLRSGSFLGFGIFDRLYQVSIHSLKSWNLKCSRFWNISALKEFLDLVTCQGLDFQIRDDEIFLFILWHILSSGMLKFVCVGGTFTNAVCWPVPTEYHSPDLPTFVHVFIHLSMQTAIPVLDATLKEGRTFPVLFFMQTLRAMCDMVNLLSKFL